MTVDSPEGDAGPGHRAMEGWPNVEVARYRISPGVRLAMHAPKRIRLERAPPSALPPAMSPFSTGE